MVGDREYKTQSGTGLISNGTPHKTLGGVKFYQIAFVRRGGLLHKLTLLLQKKGLLSARLSRKGPLVMVWVAKGDVEMYLEFYLGVKLCLQDIAKRFPEEVPKIS